MLDEFLIRGPEFIAPLRRPSIHLVFESPELTPTPSRMSYIRDHSICDRPLDRPSLGPSYTIFGHIQAV